MKIFTNRSLPYLLAGLLSVASAAACGGDDDGDGGGGTPDAGDNTPDSGSEPDGGDTPLLRAGTIAVTETRITNPGATAINLSGAVVSMSFSDTMTGTPPLEGFENNIGACAITVYELPGDQPSDATDEGAITVSGTANGEFTCEFGDAATGYVCKSTNPAIAGGSAEGGTLSGDGAAGTFTLTGAAWPAEMQGMHLVLSGFGLPEGTAFPIVAVNGDSLVLAGVPAIAITGDAAATYATFVGKGPIPNSAGFDFLGGDEVNLVKADSDLVPGFDLTGVPSGESFELAEGSALPHALPLQGPATFTCAGEGCGSQGGSSDLPLQAFVINGRTTDGELPANDPFGIAMPDPVASYATFTCAFLGASEATISAEAMEAILATNPTRIQVTLGRFAGTIAEEGQGRTSIVLGHSLTGFTTLPVE